jgi:hypothetical protein
MLAFFGQLAGLLFSAHGEGAIHNAIPFAATHCALQHTILRFRISNLHLFVKLKGFRILNPGLEVLYKYPLLWQTRAVNNHKVKAFRMCIHGCSAVGAFAKAQSLTAPFSFFSQRRPRQIQPFCAAALWAMGSF